MCLSKKNIYGYKQNHSVEKYYTETIYTLNAISISDCNDNNSSTCKNDDLPFTIRIE